MRFEGASLLALAALATAAPYDPFPLPNGFPNPSASQIKQIEIAAGGTLPNGPAPPNPNSPAAALDLQVIAFNELFEVAYFTELLKNVTDRVPGYTVSSHWDKAYIEKVLTAVIAQEELHALNANTALKAFGGTPITPTEYKFPVSNLKDALNFAGVFTELVLGALQSVQDDLVAAKATALVQLVSSIIGQEGEQTGFYRAYNDLVPSSSPFLTNHAGQFGYNALVQTVVVPGTNKNKIDIPLFDPLTVLTTPTDSDSTIKYQTPHKPASSDYLTYISGQNLPVVVPISNVKSVGGQYTFEASFPFSSQDFSKGLTVAALTSTKGPFTSAGDVAGKTIAGPGLLPVD